MINNPPPLNRDYSRDPNIKALKRRGFINHGSTLVWNLGQKCLGLRLCSSRFRARASSRIRVDGLGFRASWVCLLQADLYVYISTKTGMVYSGKGWQKSARFHSQIGIWACEIQPSVTVCYNSGCCWPLFLSHGCILSYIVVQKDVAQYRQQYHTIFVNMNRQIYLCGTLRCCLAICSRLRLKLLENFHHEKNTIPQLGA